MYSGTSHVERDNKPLNLQTNPSVNDLLVLRRHEKKGKRRDGNVLVNLEARVARVSGGEREVDCEG